MDIYPYKPIKENNVKTLVILSQKGGSGKSTLTVHLAVCAARRGLKTAILDIDKQSSAWRWNQIRADDMKLDTAKVQARELADYLQRAEKGKVRLTLVDTAPHTDSDGALAAQLADFILIPCRPALFDLEAIFSSIQIAKASRVAYGVVINAAPRGKLADETRAFLQKNSVPVLDATICHRAAYGHALLDGRSVHEFEPDGKAAAEIDDLYAHVSKQLSLDKRRAAA
jgi:chromosome partitioning protein